MPNFITVTMRARLEVSAFRCARLDQLSVDELDAFAQDLKVRLRATKIQLIELDHEIPFIMKFDHE